MDRKYKIGDQVELVQNTKVKGVVKAIDNGVYTLELSEEMKFGAGYRTWEHDYSERQMELYVRLRAKYVEGEVLMGIHDGEIYTVVRADDGGCSVILETIDITGKSTTKKTFYDWERIDKYLRPANSLVRTDNPTLDITLADWLHSL